MSNYLKIHEFFRIVNNICGSDYHIDKTFEGTYILKKGIAHICQNSNISILFHTYMKSVTSVIHNVKNYPYQWNQTMKKYEIMASLYEQVFDDI